MIRRTLLASAMGLAVPWAARAQTVTQPVRLIVPFAPGGTVDLLGRLLADALSPLTGGRSVVVENRSGAGTFIAMQAVANSAPDGHTLALAATSILSTTPVLPGATAPIDVDQALKPVTNLINVGMALVGNPRAPYRTIQELIAYGRANPGRLNIGHSGAGSLTHLLAARFALEAGITMEQIQYRGGTPALTDVMTGTADLYFSLVPESINFIREGQLRALATTSASPMAALPDTPMMQSLLPGFVTDVSYGMVATAATPPEWVAFWSRATGQVLQQPAIRERMRQLLWESSHAGPDAYREEILAMRRAWAPVIQASGIRAG